MQNKKGSSGMDTIKTGAEIQGLRVGYANDSHGWGQRDRLGLPWGFILTLEELATAPHRFYRRINPVSPMGPDLTFGVGVTVISILPSLVLQQSLSGRALMSHPALEATVTELGFGGAMITMILAILIVIPLLTLLSLLLLAALVHSLLVLFNWNRTPFSGTVKIVCYAQVAELVHLIPFCGSVLSLVLLPLLTIIGVQTLHRLSAGRATLSVMAAITVLIMLTCGGMVGIQMT